MADAFLEKATSALGEAKESVTATVETAKTSLTDAQKEVAASAATVQTEVAAAPEKVSDVSTQVGSWSHAFHIVCFLSPKLANSILI